MIIGLILVGSGIGAILALAALIIGQSVWMAGLIYAGAGVLSVLTGAVMLALRAGDECPNSAKAYALHQTQRG